MSQQTRFDLTQADIPSAWYNLNADFPEPLPPPLHPGTKEPMPPAALEAIFPKNLIEQEISAVAIDEKYAAELDAETGSPGLFVLRRYFDPADELYQIAISLYPADRFTMKTQLLRQAGNR